MRKRFGAGFKIALGSLVAALVIGLLYGTEYFLENRAVRNGEYPERISFTKRYIRLREHQPLLSAYLRPNMERLLNPDGSTQKFHIGIDGDGFIVPSKKHEAPDFNIAFLGGSTTECRYVHELKRFPYLVGNILENKLGKKINSYNAGHAGNNSLHSLNIIINKIIPLKPKAAVLMHNVNDAVLLMNERSYWNDNPHRGPIEKRSLKTGLAKETIGWVKNQLKTRFPNLYIRMKILKEKWFYKKEVDEFAGSRDRPLFDDANAMRKEFAANLRMFIAVCVAKGIVPVLMTQVDIAEQPPEEFSALWLGGDSKKRASFEFEKYKDLKNSFNDVIRKVGEETNALVINLDRIAPREEKYFYDSIHYNDLGSELIAPIISEHLLKVL